MDSCGFSWKRTCDAYALLSSACHCEAQSDGAIRSPCGSTKREAVLQANTKSVTDFPWESVVAHADSYMFLHVIARSEATWQSASPCVCHCEERSDGTIRIPCGSAKRTAVLWANAGKCNEFALSTTDLPGISAGTRIATPVCALVRNDMLKTGRCQRLQGRLARGVCRRRWHVSGCKDAFRQYTGSAPLQPLTRIFLQHVIARSGATWQSVLLRQGMTESSTLGEYARRNNLPREDIVAYADTRQISACHCEERSDVAIRSLCGRA